MTTMTTSSTETPDQPVVTSRPRRTAVPLNGVDTPKLFATIDVLKKQRELNKFRFRATNRWVLGTHSRTRIETFSGASSEHQHTSDFQFDADHPAVLVGRDNGPTPVEYLLHALASCLMAGVGNIAAARGIKLTAVEASIEGDIDLQGLLGISDEVRNGYEEIRVHFKIEGDAPAEQLRDLVEQSRNRSAVFDIVTNRVPVQIAVDAA